MSSNKTSLADLGWTPFFQSQISFEEFELLTPVRVLAVHRGLIDVAGDALEARISSHIRDAEGEEDHATVGDWLLIDAETHRSVRVLERTSLFKRRAAGIAHKVQLIAANVDTVLIVSSCNQDFNIARLERYLVLAREAGATPVVVLTKADLSDAPEDYAKRAHAVQPGLLVETVNALDPEDLSAVRIWCGKGQTVALLGSSGVGKSTLVNSLTGAGDQETQAIREDDAKGRHTTTGRSMHRLADGGWLLDTPGMREIQLTDVAEGLEAVFDDIIALAAQCRFADCTHESEPGCAVSAAVKAGELDADRLRRWRKLQAEEAFNNASLAERRAKDKAFGKMVKSVMKTKRQSREENQV